MKTLKILAAVSTLSFATISSAEKISEKPWFKPKIEITGKVQGYAIGNSQKHSTKHADKGSFESKGDLRFNARGETSTGLEYGALVAFDLRRDKVSSQDFLKSVYGYFSSPEYGMWQLGDLDGSTKQLVVDGTDVMGGTGGFDGYMWTVANTTTGVLTEYNPLSYTKYATKLVYKSPLIEGLQLAMSYTPHSQLWGAAMQNDTSAFSQAFSATTTAPSLSRIFELGLSYGFSLGDLGVNLFAAGALGNPSIRDGAGYKLHGVKTMQLGMLLNWNEFQFGAGMINNQRSMMRKDQVGNAGTAYNAALSYTRGKHTVAVGYMGSTRRVEGGRAKANVGSLTYEMKMAPGWTVFGEANYFSTVNTKQYLDKGAAVTNRANGYLFTTSTDKNNSGGVFLLGTTIRF